MKRLLLILALLPLFAASCEKQPQPNPDDNDSIEKLADITYQLNVYSFADSDGDGWGDIRGITQHLDYLDALGASALWLSPIQTSASYHGYDILDYYSINLKLGTEDDLKELIEKASEKNIDIYMDYVLNHSGRGEWFNSAISSESSPYRSYYVLSNNWSADAAAGKIDNFVGGKDPYMGGWHSATGGDLGYRGRLHFLLDWNAKTVTVTETADPAQVSNPAASLWLWVGSSGLVGLYEKSSGIYEITIDVNTDWGFLVRSSSTSWDNGTKWGGDGSSITFGKPFAINNTSPADITFGGQQIWYFAAFDSSMPDLNYGPYAEASQSAAFNDLAKSADKWINMGVNGLRLDAVMWIYQRRASANASFLKQWYDRCNATYKARGGKGEMYMVGEAWEETGKIKEYYKGLPSLFNFSYWWTLKDRIGRGKGNDFAATVLWFHDQYKPFRSDFIDAIKLSNHDEDRAGSDLNRDKNKMKLAGAVLLTSPGKPFIYQGEELGYWGTKSGGDEYIRTPVKWTVDGTVPSAGLNGKVDFNMLTGSISVEYQTSHEESVLNAYKKFARARNTHPALASGTMAEIACSVNPIALWTMTGGSETLLVAHNFSGSAATVSLSGYKLNSQVVANGDISVSGENLTLGAYSSVVFKQ